MHVATVLRQLPSRRFCERDRRRPVRNGGASQISVNALAFAAIDIPGDMVWRFLEAQGISAEQLAGSFPIGRMGTPEELVAAAMYLCSDEARYCTGTTLVLDGGYTAQ